MTRTAEETQARHVATLREELRLARGRVTLFEAALREIAAGWADDPEATARKALDQGRPKP